MGMINSQYKRLLEFEHSESANNVKITAKEKEGRFRTFAYHRKGAGNMDAIISINQDYKQYLQDKEMRRG